MWLLSRFLTLPLREQVTHLEAALCLGCARLLIFLPFRQLAPFLGRPQAGTHDTMAPLGTNQRAMAVAIRRALLRVARHLPWHSSCLVQAIAGRMMLWRRRLPSVLHLGARNDPQLAAHAWLQCGEVDVVGVEASDEYTPIAAFKA
jgi:hypothetical protein